MIFDFYENNNAHHYQKNNYLKENFLRIVKNYYRIINEVSD